MQTISGWSNVKKGMKMEALGQLLEVPCVVTDLVYYITTWVILRNEDQATIFKSTAKAGESLPKVYLQLNVNSNRLSQKRDRECTITSGRMSSCCITNF